MTLGAMHTAHELDDLLRAKDSNLNDLAGGVAGVHASVDFTQTAWAAWLADFYGFQAKWGAFHDEASAAIAADQGSALGWDHSLEESLWQVGIALLPPFDDLVRRWPALPGNPLPVYATVPTPQPTAPDGDISFLNTTAPLFTAPKASTLWMLACGVGGALVVGVSILKRLP
jgi:hypothetical protein